MPKKGKVGFISTVKPFYDESKLTARIFLQKTCVNKNPYLSEYIYRTLSYR